MNNPTIAAYDKFGDVYDREVEEFWKNFPQSTIDAFTNNLEGKRILNLGSGSGRDAVLLRDEGLDVYCVDGSKSMVDMTRKLGFESEVCDFMNLRLPKESFDGVWAYTSLLHISKDEIAIMLQKIHGWLKKDGVFLLGMIKGDFEGMKERESMPDVQRYFRHYSKKELDEIVVPVGFKKLFQDDYKPHNNTYIHLLYSKQ